jgi:CxxC-x17-CxxC domain-containing protein
MRGASVSSHLQRVNRATGASLDVRCGRVRTISCASAPCASANLFVSSIETPPRRSWLRHGTPRSCRSRAPASPDERAAAMSDERDQQITCAECGNVFPFSAAEQQFYAERGLASPPKRCKACRQARRASQGGGPGGERGPRDRGPRYASNPNQQRGPTPNGSGYGGAGGFAPRGERAGGFGGGPPRGDRGGGGPRAPGRPGGGGFNGGPRGHSGPNQSSWGTRPGEGGQRPPRAPRAAQDGERAPRPAPSQDAERAERPARARPERPRYDITCAECGTPAQVPFKPLEGRQVFCQPCYRARKGTPAAEEAATNADTDAGIVE